MKKINIDLEETDESSYFYVPPPLNYAIGKVITKVEHNSEHFTLHWEGGYLHFFHVSNCCEVVQIESIEGDLTDLFSSLLMCEQVSSENGRVMDYESYTWTFYKFATVKGYVTVRWLGSSNGYYSESVSWEIYDTLPPEAPDFLDIN